MSAASGTGTETFATIDQTVQQSTVVTSATTTSVLSAPQQIAGYFHDDLAALVQRSGISLGRDLGAEDAYDEDPRLYMNLLCADIAMLLEEQLISGVTVILFDPEERPDGSYLVRYRAIYSVRRDLALASSGQATRDVDRQGGRLEPPVTLAGKTRFSMVVDWAPNTAALRSTRIQTPPYHFRWIPARTAAFNDSQLTPPFRYGVMTSTVGELSVTRIEQATSSDLRRG